MSFVQLRNARCTCTNITQRGRSHVLHSHFRPLVNTTVRNSRLHSHHTALNFHNRVNPICCIPCHRATFCFYNSLALCSRLNSLFRLPTTPIRLSVGQMLTIWGESSCSIFGGINVVVRPPKGSAGPNFVSFQPGLLGSGLDNNLALRHRPVSFTHWVNFPLRISWQDGDLFTTHTT